MSDDTLRVDDTWRGPRSEGPGSVIGPYTLLRRIGEGGFGEVYEAQQDEPIRRVVALKVIKLGMDTREVIARFDAERQALALMDHPHIARVLDAGATDSGRPYFVMELVDGEPITSFCDGQRLAIEQRLRLFEQVCSAVQHAHTKGVIHRDLKPGNVLVGMQEGQPFARVIDFGIAKATHGRLTERTLATELDQVMGTPFYMSPEQASGSADIDTRTDVYALGVILYELLTGSTPVDRTSLRSALFAEIQRMICDVDPPRPSTRIAQDSTRTTASFRATEPRRLARMVQGDLDWIVMKALEKDRARRYETANGLAMDLRRFLAGEPVLAAPPSRAYRLQKFVRRNKGAVAAGSLVAISLLAGIAGFAWQARIAQARADELAQVSKFQAEMLGQVDPTRAGMLLSDDVRAMFAASLARSGLGEAERSAQVAAFDAQWQRVNATDAARNLIDHTVLKPATAAIDRQFRQQPLVDAALRQVLADRYVGIGLLDAAMPLQRSALATRRRVLGNEHPETMQSIALMGELLQLQGKPVDSERYMREALALRRRVLGELHPDTLTSLSDLGTLMNEQARYAEAERYDRDVLDKRRRVQGGRHRDTLSAINILATVLYSQGKFAEAESQAREALRESRLALGENDPDTINATNSLSAILYARHKLADAEPYAREALEKSRRVLGEEHPRTINSINTLATLLDEQGKLAEAEPWYRDALEKSRRTLGAEHPDTLMLASNLAVLLDEQGKAGDAEPWYRDCLEKRRRVLGAESAATLESARVLGVFLQQHGRLVEAEPYLREAWQGSRRVLGDADPDTLMAAQAMAELLVAQGAHAAAEAMLMPLEASTRKAFASDSPRRLAMFLATLGKARGGQGRFAAAEAGLLEARQVFAATSGPWQRKELRDCTQAIVNLYQAWQQAEPGKGHELAVEAWKKKLAALPAPSQPPAAAH